MQKRHQRGQMVPASRRLYGISETQVGCGIYRLGSKNHPTSSSGVRDVSARSLKIFMTCFISRYIVSYLEDNTPFAQWGYGLYLKTMQSEKNIQCAFHTAHITKKTPATCSGLKHTTHYFWTAPGIKMSAKGSDFQFENGSALCSFGLIFFQNNPTELFSFYFAF